MPSLRSSTIAALRQRVVSGENGNVNGIPFALRSGARAKDAVVPGRGLDAEADRLEPADELANVFSHAVRSVRGQLATVARNRADVRWDPGVRLTRLRGG
jgi:hypothetical protein